MILYPITATRYELASVPISHLQTTMPNCFEVIIFWYQSNLKNMKGICAFSSQKYPSIEYSVYPYLPPKSHDFSKRGSPLNDNKDLYNLFHLYTTIHEVKFC